MVGIIKLAAALALSATVAAEKPVASADAAAAALRGDKDSGEGFYVVDFVTDVKTADGSPGVISLNITESRAPLGAAHFREVIESGFYNDAAFFRVVPNFVVQFGIAGDPAENKKWTTPIKDDPVVGSNTLGTITYATSGANTRTTQMFINYKDNAFLDSQGFSPLGSVISGMDVAEAIFNPTPTSSGGVSQSTYKSKGNDWIREKYPGINFILNATIRQ